MDKIPLPSRFAADCLMGLLYHIESTYRLDVTGEAVKIIGPQPIHAVKDVLNLAEGIFEENEKNDIRVQFRMSGNDKNIFKKLFDNLGLNEDATPIELVRVLKQNPFAAAEPVKLPSILKPEFYEYNRQPGYMKESARKFSEEYPSYLVALSLVGYFLCRVGFTPLGKDARNLVAVILTPVVSGSSPSYTIDAKYRFGLFVRPFSKLRNMLKKRRGKIIGLFPEPALNLWFSCLMGDALMRLYALKEPGGQNPATIFTALQLNLIPIHRAIQLYGLGEEDMTDIIKNLVEKALDILNQGPEKPLAVRLSTLLYEVLSGTKPIGEFVGLVNREYLSSSFVGRAKQGEVEQLVRKLIPLSSKLALRVMNEV